MIQAMNCSIQNPHQYGKVNSKTEHISFRIRRFLYIFSITGLTFAMTLNVKKIAGYDEHIPHKNKKFQGIHITVQDEIMNSKRFYTLDLKAC